MCVIVSQLRSLASPRTSPTSGIEQLGHTSVQQNIPEQLLKQYASILASEKQKLEQTRTSMEMVKAADATDKDVSEAELVAKTAEMQSTTWKGMISIYCPGLMNTTRKTKSTGHMSRGLFIMAFCHGQHVTPETR